MKHLLILPFIFLAFTLTGQFREGGERTVLTKAEIDKRYQENIKKSRIDGVYIPIDYKEAIEEVKALAPDEGLVNFQQIEDEDIAARKLYFGLGRWMTLNWSFAEGSRLSHSLKTLGVVHQEDMVLFLLTMLHRDLNQDTSGPEDVVERLATKRKAIAKESIDKVLSTEVKKK
jgi:hypothetical protein